MKRIIALLLAALLMVKPDEDLMLITDDGTIIRTRAEDIRVCGRNTQGVIVMKLQEGSHVIGVARAERDDCLLYTSPSPRD